MNPIIRRTAAAAGLALLTASAYAQSEASGRALTGQVSSAEEGMISRCSSAATGSPWWCWSTRTSQMGVMTLRSEAEVAALKAKARK